MAGPSGAQRLAGPVPPQRQLADVSCCVHFVASVGRKLRPASAATLLSRLRTVGTERPIAAATSSSVISSTK